MRIVEYIYNFLAKKKFEMISILLAALIFFAIMGLIAISPIELKPIISGSMEPTLMTNTIIIVDKRVPYENIVASDIITYQVPEEVALYPVTHRVVSIDISEDDERYITTKGDNNKKEDSFHPSYETYEGKVIGKLDWTKPIIDAIYRKPLCEVSSVYKILVNVASIMFIISLIAFCLNPFIKKTDYKLQQKRKKKATS